MTRRLGTSLFIGLVHLILAAVLLHHAHRPRQEDDGPLVFMTYVAVPKVAPSTAQERPGQAPQVTAPRLRRPDVRADPAPTTSPLPALNETQKASPATSDSTPPGLDMLALRADARSIDKERIPEPFEQVRDAEARLEAEKNDLGRAIAKTKRPPCTKKYSGGTSANVFLLVPLAIDTITGKGCKW